MRENTGEDRGRRGNVSFLPDAKEEIPFPARELLPGLWYYDDAMRPESRAVGAE
ncbi:MAG: hypothetical protein V2A58_01150 [Planctomycetota bacterium]